MHIFSFSRILKVSNLTFEVISSFVCTYINPQWLHLCIQLNYWNLHCGWFLYKVFFYVCDLSGSILFNDTHLFTSLQGTIEACDDTNIYYSKSCSRNCRWTLESYIDLLFSYVYIYIYIFGPVVSNHGNLGPCPRPWRGIGTVR